MPLAILAAVVLLVCLEPVPRAQPLPITPLDAKGRVTYYINDGEKNSSFVPADRELAAWALKAWERALDGVLQFEASSQNDALVQVHWVAADGSKFGEMRELRVNGRRGAAVYISADTDALGPEISRMARQDPLARETVVYLTCLHELGHAIGMTHTADYRDIMYFFGNGGDVPAYFLRYRNQLKTRADIARVAGLSDGDIKTVRSLYPR